MLLEQKNFSKENPSHGVNYYYPKERTDEEKMVLDWTEQVGTKSL